MPVSEFLSDEHVRLHAELQCRLALSAGGEEQHSLVVFADGRQPVGRGANQDRVGAGAQLLGSLLQRPQVSGLQNAEASITVQTIPWAPGMLPSDAPICCFRPQRVHCHQK